MHTLVRAVLPAAGRRAVQPGHIAALRPLLAFLPADFESEGHNEVCEAVLNTVFSATATTGSAAGGVRAGGLDCIAAVAQHHAQHVLKRLPQLVDATLAPATGAASSESRAVAHAALSVWLQVLRAQRVRGSKEVARLVPQLTRCCFDNMSRWAVELDGGDAAGVQPGASETAQLCLQQLIATFGLQVVDNITTLLSTHLSSDDFRLRDAACVCVGLVLSALGEDAQWSARADVQAAMRDLMTQAGTVLVTRLAGDPLHRTDPSALVRSSCAFSVCEIITHSLPGMLKASGCGVVVGLVHALCAALADPCDGVVAQVSRAIDNLATHMAVVRTYASEDPFDAVYYPVLSALLLAVDTRAGRPTALRAQLLDVASTVVIHTTTEAVAPVLLALLGDVEARLRASLLRSTASPELAAAADEAHLQTALAALAVDMLLQAAEGGGTLRPAAAQRVQPMLEVAAAMDAVVAAREVGNLITAALSCLDSEGGDTDFIRHGVDAHVPALWNTVHAGLTAPGAPVESLRACEALLRAFPRRVCELGHLPGLLALLTGMLGGSLPIATATAVVEVLETCVLTLGKASFDRIAPLHTCVARLAFQSAGDDSTDHHSQLSTDEEDVFELWTAVAGLWSAILLELGPRPDQPPSETATVQAAALTTLLQTPGGGVPPSGERPLCAPLLPSQLGDSMLQDILLAVACWVAGLQAACSRAPGCEESSKPFRRAVVHTCHLVGDVLRATGSEGESTVVQRLPPLVISWLVNHGASAERSLAKEAGRSAPKAQTACTAALKLLK